MTDDRDPSSTPETDGTDSVPVAEGVEAVARMGDTGQEDSGLEASSSELTRDAGETEEDRSPGEIAGEAPPADGPDPGAGIEQETAALAENVEGGEAGQETDEEAIDDEAHHLEVVCCRFWVAGVEYHIPTASLVEISDNQRVTPVPLAPEYVAGVVSVRGQVIPVVDLGVLRQGGGRRVGERRLVIAEAGREMVAFSVDGMPDLSDELEGEEVDVREFLNSYRVVMH